MRSRSVKTFLLGFLGALLVLGPSAAWPADTVFPDKNLEAVVRTYVPKKRANQEPLTVDDVKDLARIDARHKGIKDLTGLDQCIGLETVDLSGNEIADLTPLAKLAVVKKPYAPTDDSYIQSLNLSKNKITDLKPLADLVKLQYLDLADNQITDISPLAKLTMVNTLHLTNNKVKDLSPLAGMQRLWTLEADGNAIVDIKPLAKLKRLSSLDLRGNLVTDASTLAALTTLQTVFLDVNRMRDLSPLVKSAQKDFEGEKSFAPFLRLYITGTPAPAVKAQLAALQKYGVTVAPVPKAEVARAAQ
jgi:hypothetical protein